MKIPLLSLNEHPVRTELIVFLLLLAVAFAVYGQSLANGFLTNWDDPNYVISNPDSHGFSLEHLKNAFSRFYVGNYAPLHIISYMFDYTLWGLKPSGYICHNILLHALNGYLLYLLVNKVSAVFYPSILAALLFVVHPVQVESVAWISQRKNLLAMLFYLLSLLFYAHYRTASAATCKKKYLLSLVFFACALLSKSVAVVLPVALLLYDICVERRPFRNSLVDKIPFIAVASVTSVLALLSQSEDYGGGGRAAFHGGSQYATFLTMLPVFVTYLRMIILPTGLSGVYSPDIKTAIDLSVAASGLGLFFLAFLAWLILRKEQKLFFWLAIGLVGILPVSQIVPLVTMMNDRYLYFPMAGIAPFIVLGFLRFLPEGKEQFRYAAAALLFLILIMFATMAGIRGTFWKNSLTLWSDAVGKDPDNVTAKYNLANVYLESNQLDKVKPLLEQMLAVRPESARFNEMLGHYYYGLGDLEKAESSFNKALELWPKLPVAYFSLGNIYLARNDLKNAENVFLKAEKFGSMTPDLSYSIACLESLQGDIPEAINSLENAFRLGFRGCHAVRINKELDSLRDRVEYSRIMTTYCSERGK